MLLQVYNTDDIREKTYNQKSKPIILKKTH